MNFVAEYFLHRALNRIFRETVLYGSCHYQFSLRHKWDLRRFIFGPFKYKFFHSKDVLCICNWTKAMGKVPNYLGWPQ